MTALERQAGTATATGHALRIFLLFNCWIFTALLDNHFVGIVLAASTEWDGRAEVSGESSESQKQKAARVPWMNSRLIGSPEPPLPYSVTPAFPKIDWERPLYAKAVPNHQSVLVILQGGETDRPSRVLQIDDREDAEQTHLVLEIPGRLAYGLEFDPEFNDNGFVYLFTNGIVGQEERQNRISRFVLARDPSGYLSGEIASEHVILQWRSMGHDGGDLFFGHDGMLYISSGDGTSDSDNWLSAQDPTNLLGAVLRIDVHHPSVGINYSIPPDNPFLEHPGARGELWAIGLRNPWRMSIDQQTGQIWVGNNGQDLWESVYLLGRGENYGWSVYEGSHPFYASRQLGPGKLTMPTFEHHHQESRSLTGGVVYYGPLWQELQGAYLYGDYSTGRIWAARHDGTEVLWHREIADTFLQIACFSNTHRGEILIVDHGGGIYRLIPNPALLETSTVEFPIKLSETGLFESTSEHRMASGVIPYSVNSPGWHDGAAARRFMAIPGSLSIDYTSQRGWNFPDGSVLVQTLELPDEQTPGQGRRLETRLLVRHQSEWAGYSYLWNESQDDADLVTAPGNDLRVEFLNESGELSTTYWRVPSRSECMTCHSRAVNFVLGLSHVQIDRKFVEGGIEVNQLELWDSMGLFSNPLPVERANTQPLVNPYDSAASSLDRVKSYLHTNCASCHVEAGGGNSRMNLEWTTPLEEMNILSHFPQHNTFSIAQPRIVAPGLPEQSILLARLSRRGNGQMPPLFSQQVDQQAVEVIKDWIASLSPERTFVRDWQVDDLADELKNLWRQQSNDDDGRVAAALDIQAAIENGRRIYRQAGCGQCHRIENEDAGIGPNLAGIGARQSSIEILTSILKPSDRIESQYSNTIVVMETGEVIQGRVEEETDEILSLRSSASPGVVHRVLKAEIEQRSLSTVSPMPESTLDSFERQEILDLLQFIITVPHG